MRILILVVLALAGYGFYVESRKRRRPPMRLQPGERLDAADDQPPTETGKYRVKLALGDTALKSGKKPEEIPGATVAPTTGEEEVPLPDPFSGSNDKS